MVNDFVNTGKAKMGSQTDGYRCNNSNETIEGLPGNSIDLNERLVRNKQSTFFLKMNCDSMVNAGIHCGDMLVVDRSITHVNGKIVIAVLNGEMLVRRFEKTINRIRLIPETPKLAAIEVDPFAEFAVWGVVVYSIHSV